MTQDDVIEALKERRDYHAIDIHRYTAVDKLVDDLFSVLQEEHRKNIQLQINITDMHARISNFQNRVDHAHSELQRLRILVEGKQS